MNKVELLESIQSFVLNLGYVPLDLHVRLEHGSYVIRFSIFKIEKVTLADCSRVTLALREFLRIFLGNDDFSLDVSSPGAERILRNPEEYFLFKGKKVKVLLKTGHELIAFIDEMHIEKKEVSFVNPQKDESVSILLSDIGKCQLILE